MLRSLKFKNSTPRPPRCDPGKVGWIYKQCNASQIAAMPTTKLSIALGAINADD